MHPAAHFMLGYSVTLSVIFAVVLISPKLRRRYMEKEMLLFAVTLAIFGGILADFPDLDYILGTYPGFHDSLAGYLCFFHIVFDGLAAENDLWSFVQLSILFTTTNFYMVLLVSDPGKCMKEFYKKPEEDEIYYLE